MNLTAYAVTWFYTVSEAGGTVRRPASRILRDSVVAHNQKAIPANDEITIPVGLKGGTDLVVKLQAGIFEDGTTFGDPLWLALVLQRRADYIQAIDSALKTLHAAVTQNTPREALVQQLNADLARHRADVRAAIQRETEASKRAGEGNPLSRAFDEPGQAIKDTNLRIFANEERRQTMERVYQFMIANLTTLPKTSNGTSLSSTEIIDMPTSKLNQDRTSVMSSKPAVTSNAPLP